MQELFNLLTNDDVRNAIINALHNGQAVNYDSPEFKLNLAHDGDKIIMTLEKKNTAKLEANKFKDFIQSLPDEIFQGTCEFIGTEKTKKISDCLESDNLETVTSAILAFRNALNEYLVMSINKLQNILKSV